MFLMNAPPVLPLQAAWEACGPPGSCRFPGRLPEPPEGAAGAAVSARVQMIISSLRGDRAARGRSQERGLHRGGLRGRPAQPAAPACGLAARSDPKGKEAASAPGPAGRDSDSDDSVDRGIEEAIQEYLKAKSGAVPPAAAGRDPPCRPEPPLNSAPAALSPPKRAPGSGGTPGGRVGAGQAPGPASPGSVSSEDSFEQGIRAEIERFLSEKRQLEAPPALRPSKEPAGRAPRQDAVGAGKELVFPNPPRPATVATPPRSLRSKAAAEPESVGGPKPAPPRPAAAGRTADAPGKGRARRGLGPGRRGPGVRSTGPDPDRTAADSSSDDGIEEAIQRYQRERREAASGDLPPKAPPGEQPPGPPAPGAGHAAQSASPDAPRRAPGRRKPAASKAADLGPLAPEPPAQPPKEPGAPAAPCSAAARSRLADTSAELMCAEAILDISKAILPAPGEGGARPPPARPPPGPPSVPSLADCDSSSVDSDDSIEQEIRNFLALKAQSGTLPARADTCPPSTHSPLPPPPGPPRQAGDLTAPASKAPEPPPSCRRKRRAVVGAVRSSIPKRTREAVKEGAPDTGPGPGEAPGRDGEARGQGPPCRTAGPGDEHGAADTRGGVPPGPGKVAEAWAVDGRGSSEDKSSSLDSDEDLDSAIKDLLRSKRRLRRRWREPRAGGRKRVRFGGTEALGPRGGQAGPAVLKSCLSGSRRNGWAGPPGRPPCRLCCPTERAGPGGAGPSPAPRPGLRPDDSSSVDSDDSIELEIRKFLAEKAKETESGSEAPGGAPGSGPRPEPLCRKGAPAPQPGMCTRSQRGRGTPQPTAAPPRSQPAAPRGSGGTLSARGAPAGRRSLPPHRDQSPRGASCAAEAEAQARARSPGGALPAPAQSRSAPAWSPGADRQGAPQAGLALPWGDSVAQQSALQSPWALSSGGSGPAWKGALGGERERGPEGQARGAAGLAPGPRKGLPFAGFSPLLPAQLFHFGGGAAWGAPAAGLFSPGLGLRLQGPAFSAFREAPASRRFGRPRLLGKEARAWPRRGALGGGRNSGSDEDVLDLRGRRPAGRDEDREAWGSDTSELSDTSVEDGSPVATGKVLPR
ncbi:protein phosphatase 1 regulatory subunit 26 [Pipistrellus kuhlii]|uniref:protein phosphatase 1 regulatory subunit 26 n=1 Tax=Pipistrellus kuhlii TaxID=59472 RepID=UPI001E2712BC|nr:protein phosphatase 1 regulatory subunit 26 [Pipistrellus kuhlii]